MERREFFYPEDRAAVYIENGILLAEKDRDACTWGMISHLSGALVISEIPLLQILGPLAVWIWKRNEYPFVDREGKEALNFQISMGIYGLVGWILTPIGVGWIILGVLTLIDLILIILAAVKANRGEAYRYPFNLRLIK